MVDRATSPVANASARRAATATAWLLVALLTAPSTATAVSGEPSGSRHPVAASSFWHWRQVPSRGGAAGEGLTAVAALPVSSGVWVAVGDAEGVSVRPPGESFRFAARVSVVTDLQFGPDAALWIASLSGLWRLSRDGRLEDRSAGLGEAARRVRRLAMRAGMMVLATDAGAYVSPDGGSWVRLGDGLPSGPVVAATLRVAPEPADGSTLEVWSVVGARLWRSLVERTESGVRHLGARAEVIVASPAGGEAVDVVAGLPGVDVALLYPRALALLRAPQVAAACERPSVAGAGCESRAGTDEEGASTHERRWEMVRPVLPPGAAARRLAAAGGRLWLATDRGILEADSPADSWRRTGVPAGSTSSWALAVAGPELLAASRLGLLAGSPAALPTADTGAADPARAAARLAAEPGILEVQRAALRYVGLRPERVRELRRGLARRGWLPIVSLRLGATGDRGISRDYDDSVVYGDRYYLLDEERDRARRLDGSLLFTWDFGDLAFNPDAVDLSREVRQVISLRDDVLDEITQLYFERKAVLLRLPASPAVSFASKSAAPVSAASGGGDSALSIELERQRLQLRVEELAAGLDAWTGGWFSAQIREASRRFQVPSHEFSPR